MKTIKIAGVPEHFNFPWHMAIDEGAFEDRGIRLQWTDVPEGTGRMSEMLRKGETDLAIILTEGVIKSICDGTGVQIIQEYIASPLLWGIHVHTASSFRDVSELEGQTAAISRPGSGSHLMAFLQAKEAGWPTDSLNFETVNTMEGAVNALAEARADYFLWEHFTTKPLVDGKIFRRLGDFPTPWPCFVIAVTIEFLNSNRGSVNHLLEVINNYTADFKAIPSIDKTLANAYSQKLEDIREWLKITRWSQAQLTTEIADFVVDSLYDLKLIDKKIPSTRILSL